MSAYFAVQGRLLWLVQDGITILCPESDVPLSFEEQEMEFSFEEQEMEWEQMYWQEYGEAPCVGCGGDHSYRYCGADD